MQLAGKHVFGEMSPFDIVVPMLGVVALRSARAARETALPGPFIAVATILALDTLLAHLGARGTRLNGLVEGREVLLAKAGRLLPRPTAPAWRWGGSLRAGTGREAHSGRHAHRSRVSRGERPHPGEQTRESLSTVRRGGRSFRSRNLALGPASACSRRHPLLLRGQREFATGLARCASPACREQGRTSRA